MIKTINGSFGKVYWEGVAVFEVVSFQADMKVEREDIGQAGTITKNSKIKSVKNEGKMKVKKCYTYAKDLALAYKKGLDPRLTLIGEIADPDSNGKEIIAFYDVWLNNISLMNFEEAKVLEQEFDFGFGDFDYVDTID